MDAGLRYFIEVARLGSIRAASERLNVAASAISRHVRLFEEEFGAPLLQRSVRGVELTAAGDAFLIYAKAVEAERTRARQSIDDLNGLRRGHVRIASIDGVVAGPLSDIIASFRAQHGGVTFDVRSMGTEAVVEEIRKGDADIGIAFYPTSTEGVRIAQQVIDPVCAVVGIHHELATVERVLLAAVLQFPLALPDTSFGIRRLIDAACFANRMRPNIVLETNSIEAMRGFARSGAGVTILPYLTSRRDVELGKAQAVLLDEPSFRNPTIDIFVHAERTPPRAASAFLSALCSTIGRMSMPGLDPDLSHRADRPAGTGASPLARLRTGST